MLLLMFYDKRKKIKRMSLFEIRRLSYYNPTLYMLPLAN